MSGVKYATKKELIKKMKMNTKTWIYHTPAYQMQREYWSGECAGIPIKTNVEELKGILVEFCGDTRESVIEQIKNHLGVNNLCIQ